MRVTEVARDIVSRPSCSLDVVLRYCVEPVFHLGMSLQCGSSIGVHENSRVFMDHRVIRSPVTIHEVGSNCSDQPRFCTTGVEFDARSECERQSRLQDCSPMNIRRTLLLPSGVCYSQHPTYWPSIAAHISVSSAIPNELASGRI